MSLPVPEKFHDLLTRPILCAMTTINPDGQPHTVPVWVDYDGEHVRVNSPAGAKKARNLEKNNKVSLLVIDPQSNYHWIEVQGYVAEVYDDAHGSLDHINKLSEKYTGNPVYQAYGTSGTNRLMYVIEATKINGG